MQARSCLIGIVLVTSLGSCFAQEGQTRVLFDAIPFYGIICDVQDSSDGNWLIANIGEPDLGDAWVYNVHPDQRMLLRTEALVHSVCPIPGADWFAVGVRRPMPPAIGGDAKVEIRRFSTPHKVLRSIPARGDYVCALTAAPNGKRLAFRDVTRFGVVDVVGNQLVCSIPMDDAVRYSSLSQTAICWSADGSELGVLYETRYTDRRNVIAQQWRVAEEPALAAELRGNTMGTIGFRGNDKEALVAWPDAHGVRVTTLDGTLIEHHRTGRYAQCEYALSSDCKKLLVWGYNGRDLQVHHLGAQERPSEWRGEEGERITSARFDVSGRGVLIASHTISQVRQYRIKHWLWQQ